MTTKQRITTAALIFLATCCSLLQHSHAAQLDAKLIPGDHVCYIGNTLADRMQHHAWLETYIHAKFPTHNLTFRNLGFPGDELKTRPRSNNFGDADQWLTACKADVVFCFFGYNESYRGPDGLSGFEADLNELIDSMSNQKYNGRSAPRLVFFSPIAHEDLQDPNLPDGSANNVNLSLYTESMRKVCAQQGVPFFDLFSMTQQLYSRIRSPLTMNGIHLLETGNKATARCLIGEMYPERKLPGSKRINQIRTAVLDKNYHWFSRYRVVDGYNVYGGRSKLAWHGQSNADVMRREMEIFDVMTKNRDRHVWSVARGMRHKVVDDSLPPEVEVKTNKQGPEKDGRFPYLGGKEAVSKMTVAKGMDVNLFASEEMFPRLVNPVQVAVDTDSRLWASVWPSYPHWNPTEKAKDALVILPDEDGNGVADKCIVFADELNSVTGFEFWNGGVLVAAPPEIWYLKDSDGDDKADVKIRMLQGVSSADTHHSANAVVVGPDGWLYWSRGIFNIANFETPTHTYRSDRTGVHRFNPRTFEVEFRFPIGPNPHGDVFDQWGYQFVNDGTGGTGSYVNIGKGIGNKQWFRKRVRPVAATGILSSSHFPDANNGNFLICNTIGVLGLLQHEVSYNGADINATEVEPIVLSSDPNFRPSDVEVGGDGAIYISDWHNALIGHMQHNMRDPNRDQAHGRIYRVTYTGRDLMKPVKLSGKPIETVCEQFFVKSNSARYRARLELTGRTREDIVSHVGAFASRLDPGNVSEHRDEAQALLECLWVFEEQRLTDLDLLRRVFLSEDPRIRAAAIRTLGHWAGRIDTWESLLVAAARDDSPLVRAEAVKSAVEFGGLASAEIIFEAATRPTDPELDTVIKYAQDSMNVDAVIQDSVKSGKKLSSAAYAYVLQRAVVEDLLRLDRTEEVFRAILSRKQATADQLKTALNGLAKATSADPTTLLMELIADAKQHPETNLVGLGHVLARQPAADLLKIRDRIEDMALRGESPTLKRAGYAAWIAAAGPDDAFLSASQSRTRLKEFLDAVPHVNADARGALFAKVQPLLFDLPSSLKAESTGAGLAQPGVRVDYFEPNPANASLETFAKLKPVASGIVPEIALGIPQQKRSSRCGLRYSGVIQIPKSGKYTFFTSSDDGSRLYVANKLVVNNDGLHGMAERNGTIDLDAGPQPIVVTYFNNEGENGLSVSWKGPGIDKQKIPAERLAVRGGETLHDVAIRALVTVPGHDTEKFVGLASLVARGKHRSAAIKALRSVPDAAWPKTEIGPLVDNLLGYLSEIPAQYRTGPTADDAVALAKSLAAKLSADQAQRIEARLQNLDVRIIAIGTVPHRMIFDKERIVVQAGKPVEFRFSNTDAMPHNFAITVPGSLAEVGELAEATGREPDAIARHYIPKTDQVLLASVLLQPGQNEAMSFEVPSEPGVYPYVCTYPGHWRRMYGALYVVPDVEAYQANPDAYLAANPLPIKDELLLSGTRGREWKYSELQADVKPLPHGRSFDVGRELFKAANCVACHKLNDEGRVFGPDLTKLDVKKQTPEFVLQSLLEPSKDIDEKYQSYTFAMDDGKSVTGMIMEETENEVRIVIDPLAKDKPTALKKDEIEERVKSAVSLMPQGLLDKLSREEILDLVAYVFAKGDKKHELFMEHHH
jgi:putative heme-binding domain-containing protein